MTKGDRYTPEQRAEMRALFDQTEPRLSYAEIAAQASTWPGMGRVTKGAVIRAAIRWKWPARPGPVRNPFTDEQLAELRAAFQDRSAVLDHIVAGLRQRGGRYADLTSEALKGLARQYGWGTRSGMVSARILARRSRSAARIPPPAAPSPAPAPAPAPTPQAPPAPPAPPVVEQPPAPAPIALAANQKACEWPMGDPRDPGFRWCGCAAVRRNPFYCAAHSKIAFEREHGPFQMDRAA